MSYKTKKTWKRYLLYVGVAFVAFLTIPQVREVIGKVPFINDLFEKAEAKIKG